METLTPLRALVVEDNPADAELLADGLRRAGFQADIKVVKTERAFRAALSEPLDLILSDFSLPSFDAMRALAILRESRVAIPCIVVSGTIGEELAIECLQAGAADYLLKDRLARLGPSVRNALAQKRLRDEQLDAEARLRLSDTILRNVPALVLVGDSEGDIIYVSPSVRAILGYSPEEVMGDGWWKLTRKEPQARRADREHVARAARGEESPEAEPYERVVQHKDGKSRVILWQDSAGPDRTLIGVGQDITERKVAEAQLARLASFPERNPQPVVELDSEGKITYVNPAARAQFPDLRARGLTHPLLANFAFRLLRPGNEGTRPLHKDVRVDQNVFHATFSYVADIDRYRLYLTDITQRYQAEAALEGERQIAEALRDSAESLSRTLDRDEVLERILTNLQRVIPHETSEISMIEDGVARVVRHRGFAERGLLGHISNMQLKVDETPNLRRILETGQPEILHDVRQAPGWITLPGMEWVRGFLGIPLRIRGDVVGFLNLASDQSGTFTEQHLPAVRAFADQAAQALTNARLFGDAQRRLARLQGMRTVDTAITSSTDLKLTLSILAETLAQHLGAAVVDILLLNPYSQTLEFAAGRTPAPSGFPAAIPLGQGHAGRAGLERRAISAPDLEAAAPDPRAAEWKRLGLTSYVGLPLLVKGKLKGVLEVLHKMPFRPDAEEMEFLQTMAGQAAIAIENASLFSDLQRSVTEVLEGLESILEGLSRAIDRHNLHAEGHSLRVAETAVDVARRLGVGGDDLVHMRWSALLHDLGMLEIPDEVLRRVGPLTEEEWDLVRLHPRRTAEWMSSVEILGPAAEAAHTHHERLDGSGYPGGLRGDQIPQMGAILSVAVVYHGMQAPRPYRPAASESDARAYLERQAGRGFDAAVVRSLLDSVELRSAR
jgi:PAS domain S-box-containing protein